MKRPHSVVSDVDDLINENASKMTKRPRLGPAPIQPISRGSDRSEMILKSDIFLTIEVLENIKEAGWSWSASYVDKSLGATKAFSSFQI